MGQRSELIWFRSALSDTSLFMFVIFPPHIVTGSWSSTGFCSRPVPVDFILSTNGTRQNSKDRRREAVAVIRTSAKLRRAPQALLTFSRCC